MSRRFAAVVLLTLVGCAAPATPAPPTPVPPNVAATVAAQVALTVAAIPSPTAVPVPTVVPLIKPAASPSAAPVAAGPGEIIRQGQGAGASAPFALNAGNYVVRWTAASQDRSPCLFSAILRSVANPQFRVLVGNVLNQEGAPVDGEGWAYNVPGGQYFLEVNATCGWAAQVLAG